MARHSPNVNGEWLTANGQQRTLPGLYIHVPFCKTKCPYCDFFSLTDTVQVEPWIEGIAKELTIYKDRFPLFDSLYLGGGTPSLLSEADIARLMASIISLVTFSSVSEMTIEVNPDDVTLGKIALIKGLGVNRISVGVQSFHDRELQYLQRRHTSRQSDHALEIIRVAGFTNLSIDLIYGLEGQTETEWIKTLERALSYTPEHLSCYELTIEENTPFGRSGTKGRKLLDEEAERSFFLLTSSLLHEHGYSHYEISNFSQSESFACRHNQKYWNHTNYLGLGPAAHSFKDGRRWWNVRSLHRYCDMLHKNNAPVEGGEILSDEQRYLEELLLGFRTAGGIDMNLVAHHPRATGIFNDLQKEKLIIIENGRARPTPDGFLVADSLPLLFVRQP